MNGKVTEAPLAPEMRLLQQAEQVAREVAATQPSLVLNDISSVRLPSGPVFIISIASAREPTPEDVGRFESLLRERLAEPSLRVIARRTTSTDVTSKGRILLGGAHFGDPTDDASRAEVERVVRANLESLPNLFALAVDAVHGDDAWVVRAEVVGPRVVEPIRLSLWARTELQVTDQGYEPLGERSADDTKNMAPPSTQP